MTIQTQSKTSRNSKAYYVYILRCKDDSLYTGITPNIEQRIKAHLGIIKGGARYTKSHPVKNIEAAWKTENRSAASQIECILKRLSKAKKLSLISRPYSIFEIMPKYNISEVCSKESLNKIFDKINAEAQ